MKNIYLDYAAATPLDPEVRAAMEPFWSHNFYNPSASYLASRNVRQEVDKARQTVAQILGARPAEIIFTSGATEANNLAILGLPQPAGDILVSAVEHESVLQPAISRDAKLIPVSQSGLIDLDWLENNIQSAGLVSIIYVSNEIGVIQPLSEVARIVETERQRRKTTGQRQPLYLHSDATQAANFLDLHVARLGLDLMTVNGGKIYGPKQTGALYVKAGTKLAPQISGGGQEFGLRSGTENVPGIIGFAKALSLAQGQKAKHVKQIVQLKQLLKEQITKVTPTTEFNGSVKQAAPHILSVTFPGFDNERLMMELDEKGVQVAVGSACNASSDEPSPVLAALGLDAQAIRSTLRFSLGKYVTPADIQKAIKILGDILKQQ